MGPLNGLKVLEFPAIGPVPFCAMLLADLGATVLRLVREEDAGLGIKRDQRFQISHRGRKILKLDLKKPQALKMAEALIDRSDVLIEGFPPGRDGAIGTWSRRLSRQKSPTDLRPHDRLGTNGTAGGIRRP